MSVLIKGMAMPKKCGECPFQQITLGIDGKPVSFCTALWKFNNPLSDNCPLVEVPKHGRLIDADALTQRFFQVPYVCNALSLSPTIIEAEGEDGSN